MPSMAYTPPPPLSSPGPVTVLTSTPMALTALYGGRATVIEV
ncbi:hypothetical protein ACIGXG_10030 [Streptomyces goshikiensis]